MNTVKDLISLRLQNQQISSTAFKKPEEIVSWMLAMQSQEYAMAKWAIGLRLPDSTDNLVEQAFNEGKILRTHLMRPTWHFVTPEDIRWLVALTAPRVQAFNAFMYRKTELDSKILNSCNDLLIRNLENRRYRTRNELKEKLSTITNVTDGMRLAYIVMNAELQNLICSGPRRGKQFTYALTDERAPSAPPLTNDEALFQLCRRYFSSRGPATVHDLSWWSGLSITDCKKGIASLDKTFITETIEGKSYVFSSNEIVSSSLTKRTFLLPDYDEYGISYKDRSVLSSNSTVDNHPATSTFFHIIVIDGLMGGWWKQNDNGKVISMKLPYLDKLSQLKKKAVLRAAKAYTDFFGRRLQLTE
ncbi:winged helix DNA-binding domain-containing protein [Pedobacter sp. HMF7647]|uniref:Winged helix DNA-binding domain-containing protein n=1 Tax=Hufsiella arboris TaxID=2695275 RepID=A0A7K1YE40_9SPHI|nr:winged helix DNA-binding domain-containing protein [Hufsiella arboris]MXV52855.1 winged helix DNA-binding domain-containing protein [Hufsiella arboris]